MEARRNLRWPSVRRGPRVYLHIGAMKSGTTYLQAMMEANREPLAAAGYAFAGRVWSDQSRAVRDALFNTADPRLRALTEGMWAKMAAEMCSHSGKASILSMEFLSFADPEAAARIMESLAGADVRVILTVRDAAGAIPSQWQTNCRSGGKIPYPRYLRGVRAVVRQGDRATGKPARLFQRTQGIPRMLDTWVPLVGAKRAFVITVPPRGSDPRLLWRRFASAIKGLDPSTCVRPPLIDNVSLGHASAELLRLLNAEIGPLPMAEYGPFVKGTLARGILSTRAAQERPVTLNHRGMLLAGRWNRQVSHAISESGARVIGSLDELPHHQPGPGMPAKLPSPSEEELLAAAATARDGLTAVVAGLEEVAAGSSDFHVGDSVAVWGRPFYDPRTPSFLQAGWQGRTDPTRWSSRTEPVSSAIEELAEHLRRGLEIYRALDERYGGTDTQQPVSR